jgi:hypothetical protein
VEPLREFDQGYTRAAYRRLVEDFPDETTYPTDSFRVEWGPVFHRGRLDGMARVLVIGQDPATHETICRRILVGEAGQRIQGFLAKLGITRSYVLVNTFVYSVYGQGGGERHIDTQGIVDYRHRWFNEIHRNNELEAIISLGRLADRAYQTWRETRTGKNSTAAYAAVTHPTYPESASASGQISKSEAFIRLTTSWNSALEQLAPVVTADVPTPLELYTNTIETADLAPIPLVDLPAGLPTWMGALEAWASRSGDDAQSKRATIKVAVPRVARTWPPVT